MPRLTYKLLSKLVSEKLRSLEIEHDSVETYNPRHSSDNIEGGACLIIFKVYSGKNWVSLLGWQWRAEIEQIINSGSYRIQIKLKERFTINDAEVCFEKI